MERSGPDIHGWANLISFSQLIRSAHGQWWGHWPTPVCAARPAGVVPAVGPRWRSSGGNRSNDGMATRRQDACAAGPTQHNGSHFCRQYHQIWRLLIKRIALHIPLKFTTYRRWINIVFVLNIHLLSEQQVLDEAILMNLICSNYYDSYCLVKHIRNLSALQWKYLAGRETTWLCNEVLSRCESAK